MKKTAIAIAAALFAMTGLFAQTNASDKNVSAKKANITAGQENCCCRNEPRRNFREPPRREPRFERHHFGPREHFEPRGHLEERSPFDGPYRNLNSDRPEPREWRRNFREPRPFDDFKGRPHPGFGRSEKPDVSKNIQER